MICSRCGSVRLTNRTAVVFYKMRRHQLNEDYLNRNCFLCIFFDAEGCGSVYQKNMNIVVWLYEFFTSFCATWIYHLCTTTTLKHVYTFMISNEDARWQKIVLQKKEKKNTKEETNVIIENKSFITGRLDWLFVCYFCHFNQGKYSVSLLTTLTDTQEQHYHTFSFNNFGIYNILFNIFILFYWQVELCKQCIRIFK